MRVVAIAIALIIGLVGGYLIGGMGAGRESERTAAPAALLQAGPSVTWKMASAYSSTTPVLGSLALRLADNVEKISAGTVKIKFFEPGALVPALEVFDAVSSGSVEVGWATPGFWAGKAPALQLFASVPFGPASAEYMAWMYYGGGLQLYEEMYARHNIKGLPCGLLPPEASGWFRNEINTVDDLKGLKMRFFALGARVMEKLGVSTQLLAGGDIYPALELGTIDATEYSSPAIDRELGFYQIAKHYYFPGWHQQSTFADIIINLDKWKSLSPTQQIQITTACGDQVRDSIAQGESLQVSAMAFLKDKGVIFHKWSPEFIDAYRAAWDQVVAEEVAKDADFANAWESLRSFREAYKDWRELAYLR